MDSIKVGLIGFGTIGTGVVRILQENSELMTSRSGVQLELVKIADRDLKRKRTVEVNPSSLTTDAEEILRDPQIQIVIELVGGIHPAKEFILKALKQGKHVVTANKALLAEHGKELLETAARLGKNLFFEASVGGGIPVIKGLREGLVGNHFKAIYGIVNGTANYILTKMSFEKLSFEQALKEAKALGYAEADPTFDVKGIDSAHKLVILASLAYGHWIDFEKVYVEGITEVTDQDIHYARQFGYDIKLLAITKDKGRSIEARVHPTLIPSSYLLASVRGVYNAIYYHGDYVGRGLFYGRGAGEKPTASAVVSDVIDIVKQIKSQKPAFVFEENRQSETRIQSIDELECRCYLRFSALDQPGVLARIAGILGEHRISISSVIQDERHESGPVPVVIMTHEAKEKNFREAIEKIDRLDVIRRKTLRIRVEEEKEKEEDVK
ncbi:MAG: homoserine dehydrogenase [Chlamydiae bacterium]|nr:homoserine dehydrogenase [Chlamydiota bacterium]MBI3277487.1 homoserine dehydrogenase [Chlamydiota bacterium]